MEPLKIACDIVRGLRRDVQSLRPSARTYGEKLHQRSIARKAR